MFQFIDGFAPTAGDTYMFLESAGDADLSDADFQIGGLLPGFEYLVDPEVPGGPLMLTALTDGAFLDPLAADFNEDGNVDGSDLIALQRGYGLTSDVMRSDGDADGNGAVDGVDLSIWQDQFGNVADAGNTAVPEPATWTITLLLVLVLGRNAGRLNRTAGTACQCVE